MKRKRLPVMAGLAAASTLLTTAAADDWPQYRKDEWHSAFSKDPIPGRLTEIWSRAEAQGVREALLYDGLVFMSGQAAANGRAQSTLNALEMRTGKLSWAQPTPSGLKSPHGNLGIAEGGTVFAVGVATWDEVDGKWEDAVEGPPKPHDMWSTAGSASLHFVAYRCRDGSPVRLPNPYLAEESPDGLLRGQYAFLQHPPLAHVTSPLLPTPEQAAQSPLLMVGRDIVTASAVDMLYRWPLEGTRTTIQRYRVIHPHADHKDLTLIPRLEFRGYPACKTGGGIFWAEDSSHRCLFVQGENGGVVWHRDLPWTAGIPSGANEFAFLNIGTKNARQSIMAIHATTGVTRWMYPPGPPQQDGVMSRGKTRNRYEPVYNGDLIKDTKNFTRPPDRSKFAKRITNWQVGPKSILKPGHEENGGLVLWGDRLIGETFSKLVCLDQGSGKEYWVHPLGAPAEVMSMVACPDRVLVAYRSVGRPYLRAIRIADGKEIWTEKLDYLGPRSNLSASQSLVFLSDGQRLRAFTPAERTFRMAVDSGSASDYRLVDPEPEPPASEGSPSEAIAAPKTLPAAPSAPSTAPATETAIADASVLRLNWNADPEALVERVRARRKLIGTRPLLVSVNWLDPFRSKILGSAKGIWTDPDRMRFATLCAQLAKAGATYLDVAPEVNVFLARYPNRMAEVRLLVSTARDAVRRGNLTRVLVSFNVETLIGGYGKGTQLPFGELPVVTPESLAVTLQLVGEVDAIGVTLRPRSAMRKAEEMPADRLLSLQPWFKDKPMVVTGISVPVTEKDALPTTLQTGFIRKALQACYWLDSPLVAAPEVVADEAGDLAASALRIGKTERESMDAWRHTFGWKPVRKLTSTLAGKGRKREHTDEDAEEVPQ